MILIISARYPVIIFFINAASTNGLGKQSRQPSVRSAGSTLSIRQSGPDFPDRCTQRIVKSQSQPDDTGFVVWTTLLSFQRTCSGFRSTCLCQIRRTTSSLSSEPRGPRATQMILPLEQFLYQIQPSSLKHMMSYLVIPVATGFAES